MNASTSSRKTSVGGPYRLALAMNFERTSGDTRVVRCADFGDLVAIVSCEIRCSACKCITVVPQCNHFFRQEVKMKQAKKNPGVSRTPGSTQEELLTIVNGHSV